MLQRCAAEPTSPFSSSLLIGTAPLFTIALLAALGERQSLPAWSSERRECLPCICKARATMKNYGLTLLLRDDPEKIAEYRRQHQAVWPGVTARLRECGIQN